MRKLIELFIYLAGVVFYSWNYYKLKGALNLLSFITFTAFFLFGVSKFATFASHKVNTLIESRNTNSGKGDGV